MCKAAMCDVETACRAAPAALRIGQVKNGGP